MKHYFVKEEGNMGKVKKEYKKPELRSAKMLEASAMAVTCCRSTAKVCSVNIKGAKGKGSPASAASLAYGANSVGRRTGV